MDKTSVTVKMDHVGLNRLVSQLFHRAELWILDKAMSAVQHFEIRTFFYSILFNSSLFPVAE